MTGGGAGAFVGDASGALVDPREREQQASSKLAINPHVRREHEVIRCSFSSWS
jgi:hypothetical protein